ncbi:NAD(P)H-binding protein [Nocardia sp. NPDC024068]|uniref:NAD(P)-dependent oxidoreductase n=1 Tax=Nocardia sp. NPDC024068 TaxID=3157197 RepID=UPI003408AD07
MKIVVVGATGMVGSRVVSEAAGRGHDLLAVQRSAPAAALPAAVTVVQGDANDPGFMSALFAGADAVVAATRPRPGDESSTGATTTALLDAAAKSGTRVLVVGGAAPLRVPGTGRLVLDSPEYVPAALRPIAGASAAQLEACREHPADWVYLSPPAVLEPGVRTAQYRRGTTTLLVGADGTSRVSAEDFAVAVLDELEVPCGNRHITVGY